MLSLAALTTSVGFPVLTRVPRGGMVAARVPGVTTPPSHHRREKRIHFVLLRLSRHRQETLWKLRATVPHTSLAAAGHAPALNHCWGGTAACWGAGAEDRGSVGRRSRDGCADRPGDASPSGLTRRCPPKPGRPSQALSPLGSTGNRGCERQRFSWAHGRPRVGRTLDEMKDDAPPSGRPGPSANGTWTDAPEPDTRRTNTHQAPWWALNKREDRSVRASRSPGPGETTPASSQGGDTTDRPAEGSLKKRLSGQNPFPPRGR